MTLQNSARKFAHRNMNTLDPPLQPAPMRPEHLGTLGRQNMIRPSAEGIQPRTSSCELLIHQEDPRERLRMQQSARQGHCCGI